MTSLVAQTVKRLPTMQETRVQSLGREDLLEQEWQLTPVFLPRISHGRRNVVVHGITKSWRRLNEYVKVTQSCLTLCDLTDYTVRGILRARILEWIAFPFSRGSSQPRD